jgi:cytoskeletal protein RodZ
VNIGGALAEARSEVGLTITEVSKRTRIRETIIRDIERDDYSACGGDFYARGHIRAIARVVGADPGPLIEQYDAARLPPPQMATGNHAGTDRAGHRIGPGLAALDADTDPELDAVTSEPPDTVLESARRWAAARRDVTGRPVYSPPGITAAEAFRPGLPMDFERRRPRVVWLLGLVVLVLIGAVIYLFVSRGSSSPGKTAPPPRTHHSGAAAAHRTGGPSPGTTTPAASATPATPLAIASAAAFGPAGTSQGDDPQDAALTIDGSSTTSWLSDWYATPHLGGLQSGTGLLFSLGKAVTITSATVVLGPTPGGTVELRAGDTATLADLSVVASAANPGGTLTMRLGTPVQARYALLWFTSLPPDGTGTYQVRVFDVRLMGYPG